MSRLHRSHAPRRLAAHALLLMAVAALVAALPGCERTSPTPTPAPTPAASSVPSVVCTVGMVADVAQNVAGGRAPVACLMGPGIDPHLYKPTRTDVQQMLGADLILYNGLLLEGKLTDTLIRAATSGKKVCPVTEQLEEASLLEPEEFQGHYDPHVWMDPRTWVRTVAVVRDKLAEADPAGAAEYSANAQAYAARLDALDAYAAQVLGSVPEQQRVLVTAHDAFNYFGRRYGYTVVGIQGISTESEAGVQDIERLVDMIVRNGVRAVFVESTVSERNINALVTGARARGHELAIGGRLYSDAMGDAGTYEGTYIGMIDHNATTIARALGGTAPERGMNGQLAQPAEH